jgi:hypothetical protein
MTALGNTFITNSKFRFTNHPGTGNKSCKVAKAEKLRLSNILIDSAGVKDFMDILYASGERKIRVELSNRNCSRRWGSAWTIARRVKIYRHTVWVFLHEVAHILDVKKNFTGMQVAAHRPHGREFGQHLACLYGIWKENCDKGINNVPQKPEGKPNLEHDYFVQADAAIPNKWKVPQRRPRLVGGISLQVGDGVWFMGRGRKIFARVIRVNTKTCRVKPIDGTPEWRVSPKLLNKTYLPNDAKYDAGLNRQLEAATPVSPSIRPSDPEREEILKAWKLKYRS